MRSPSGTPAEIELGAAAPQSAVLHDVGEAVAAPDLVAGNRGGASSGNGHGVQCEHCDPVVYADGLRAFRHSATVGGTGQLDARRGQDGPGRATARNATHEFGG